MGPSEMVIDLARGAEVLILEATLENGATDDTRRGHLDASEAIDHVRRSGVRQGILVHYWSERRETIRELCAASGLPVEPGVPGWSSTSSRARSASMRRRCPPGFRPRAAQPSELAPAAPAADGLD